MKFLYPVVLCGLALLFTSSLKAQDYFITKTGDTVKCEITFPFMSTNPQYKSTGDKAIKIDPTEVKEYFLSEKNKTYGSVVKGDKPMFMEFAEKGKINLFVVTSIKSSSSAYPFNNISGPREVKEWYAAKTASDTVLSLSGNGNGNPFASFEGIRKYKQQVADLFKDNQEVYNKYTADKQFNITKLKKFIRWYNTGVWVEKVDW